MMLIGQLQPYKWHFSPHSIFTKESIMKPFWKSVTGEGEGSWLLLPFDPIMSFTSKGRRQCNEEAPFPSPGFESVSSRILSSPSASALSRGPRGQPATAGVDKRARSSAGNTSLEGPLFHLRQRGHFQRARFPLIDLCWDPVSSW